MKSTLLNEEIFLLGPFSCFNDNGKSKFPVGNLCPTDVLLVSDMFKGRLTDVPELLGHVLDVGCPGGY